MTKNKIFVIFAFMLAVAVFAAVPGTCHAFSGGSGTPDDPYLIATPEELDEVRYNLSSSFKLTADIDLSGWDWTPIGKRDENVVFAGPFAGVFDGNGHVIRNLHIHYPINKETSNIGLFSETRFCEIKNLGLENVDIKGCNFVGALVGRAEQGTKIINCYVKNGSVIGVVGNGGMVGYSTGLVKISENYSYGEPVKISRCYVTGVDVSGIHYSYIGSKTGGLVGYVENTSINECYVTGGSVKGENSVGGIVGFIGNYAEFYLSNSFAIVPVSGWKDIGGLMGFSPSGYRDIKINMCYSTGKVLGKDYSRIGGLLGTYYGTDPVVENSFWALEPSGCLESEGGGISKPASLMKKKDTYTAAQWDFINTWDIEEGESYPWLRGLPRPPEVGGTSTVSVTGVTLNKHELILTENGPSETLTVAIEPSDTTNKDVTWTSSDESVVSVSDGVVTPVGVGTAVITVKTKDGGYTDTCFVTVNPALKSIAVTPTAVNITEDKSQQLTVTAHYSDGSTKDITGEAEYTSSDTGITTVSVNGLVSGITPGSAAVTITYEGKSVTVPVTVNAAITLQSITVTPNPVVIDEGNTAALSVLANYSDGSTKDITDEAEYTSDNSAIATVNTSGLVTGITPGTTTVTVSYNSITSNINITVNEAYAPPVLENITVSPAVVNILTGKTQSLAVTAYYSDGSTKDVTGSASYQVANASIATVVGSTVQGVSIGSTTITVRYEGKTATVPITITEPRGDDTGSDTTVITKPRGDDTGSDTTVITKPRGDDTGSDITVITKPRGDDTGSNTTVITKPRGDDTGSNITVITKPRGDDTGSNITVITKPRGDDTGSNTTVITKPRGDDTGSNITVITKTR